MRKSLVLLCALVGATVVSIGGIPSASATAAPAEWQRTEVSAPVPYAAEFWGVNDHGDAVGSTVGGGGPLIRYAGQPAQVLSDPSWSGGTFFDINARGQAAGTVTDQAGVAHGFVYDHGAVRMLPITGAAFGINDAGVVGVTDPTGTPWLINPDDSMRALDRGGYDVGFIRDVANGDWAAGIVQMSGGPDLPAVWNPSGQLTVLPIPPGSVTGEAWRVNSHGDVAGYATGSNPATPLVWRAGQMTVLPTGSFGSGGAFGISDSGLIAGTLVTADATTREGVVWDGNRVIAVDDYSAPVSPAEHLTVAVSENGSLAGWDASGPNAVVYQPTNGVLVNLTVSGLGGPLPSDPVPHRTGTFVGPLPVGLALILHVALPTL
jgi:hypothetical protein